MNKILKELPRKFSFMGTWKMNTILIMVITLVIGFIFCLPGCQQEGGEEIYQNSKTGLVLEKPNHWNVYFTERNGITTLVAESGVFDKERARIEIDPGSCTVTTNDAGDSPESGIEFTYGDIKRIQNLYGLSSIDIIEAPVVMEQNKIEIVYAVISVPTTSMQDDKNRIQIEIRPDQSQIIEIYYINHGQIVSFIYTGNDEKLNSEAREIILSIVSHCVKIPNYSD